MNRSKRTPIQHAVTILSSPQKLAQLEGVCKDLDNYFGLIGPDSLAAILADRLPTIFEHDSKSFAQVQQLTDKCSDDVMLELPQQQRETIALLLVEVIQQNELWRDIGDILSKTLWKTMAKVRREGGSNGWTEMEDERHEKLLTREYAGIESQIFQRLKLGACADAWTGAPLRTAEPQDQVRPTKRQRKGAVVSAGESELMSWEEMQSLFNSFGHDFFDGVWKKEPQKTLLWILQNGTKEQWFAFVHENADKFDDEIKTGLLGAIEADEAGEIPVVWRTILLRALSRPRIRPDETP